MATTIDRSMAMAEAALLPGLLPTPPRSTMIAPCLIIIPSASFASSKPKPGRADAVERWDAHKNDKKPCFSPVSSSGSTSGSPGRASSCEHWDSNKIKSPSGSTSSSSSSRGSSTSPGRADSVERWVSNKRPPSRASSADRWDTHKKSRSAQADAESRTTGEQEEQEINDKTQKDETTAMVATAPRAGPVFSGPSFFASPEPSMLPMPTFLALPEPGMLPVPVFLLLAH